MGDEKPEQQVRDQAWVTATFGDVEPTPSNEVVVDPSADEAPNTGHPK